MFEEVRAAKEGEDFVVVDAGGSVEGVSAEIRRVVGECLGREGGELRVVGEW